MKLLNAMAGVLILCGALMLTGCEPTDSTPTPGQRVDQGIQNAQDALDDAKDAANDGIDAAKRATKDGIDAAKDAVGNAADAVKDSTDGN